MNKGNTLAETVYFEITDAMDLLESVTADGGSSCDNLGQAELALGRARDIMAEGALQLFAEAPAMLAALRQLIPLAVEACAERACSEDDEDRQELLDYLAYTESARALIASIDATPTAEPEPPTGEAGEVRLFVNRYTCYQCGHDWSDEWSCACDDDCPACGARHMSPHSSDAIDGEGGQ